jgi:fatty acid desaturase
MKMTEEQIYEAARKRVEEKRGFYTHFTVYAIVNLVLFLIWFFTGRGFPWFVFPLGGWGIGIVFHFLGVFIFEGKGNQAAIEKEAATIRRQQGQP